jgi:hypothetical protein
LRRLSCLRYLLFDSLSNDGLLLLFQISHLLNKDVASKRVRALNGSVRKVRNGRHVAISLLN